MLDNETKTRINTARDILVGKVPDPKSQVEQITIALIYKFMDDMDAEAEELGGARTFFTGEYEKYGWAKLMAPGRGGHEVLNLYAEAITKMTENEGIPTLFREIFKNAYLPYRDPETLKSFLKVIDDFNYDHSEKLGDAFEYLLSVLGSQGDAGQFRTPRHIIDFMVAVIDPQKNERILDPACGTAGFLISSYKHVLAANAANGIAGAALTPDERTRLVNNVMGYDISPDMVRLSLVNLYLHGFSDPHIYEYDTLTSDERWNEYFDIILANPPFMSPKGGIKPHKRFSVQSKRSEVLFVDYIAEHLSPNGRAAVIVPEGVIFQSGKAYKKLRKLLVDDYLVGVISLPAGVFNPYSGVKTSILWLDKALAKQTDQIAFVKIENDGFGLGAQRREVKGSDLPEALAAIADYKASVVDGIAFDDAQYDALTVVDKTEIAENGDYNLSGERYKSVKHINTDYPLVKLGNEDLFAIESGGTPSSRVDEYWNGEIKWITLVDLPAENFITEIVDSERKITEKGLQSSSAKIIPPNSVVVSSRATIGRIGINRVPLATNQGFKNVIIKNFDRVLPEYLAFVLTGLVGRMEALATGGTFKEISKTNFKTLQIPLPPTAVQAEIVAEIESYQKIIDGARQVVENYRPRITIHPDWPLVELGEVAEFKNGLNFSKSSTGERVKIVGVRHFQDHVIAPIDKLDEIQVDSELKESYFLAEGDLLFVRSNGNKELVGRSIIIPSIEDHISFSGFTIRCRFTENVNPLFYAYLFKSDYHRTILRNVGRGANIRNLSQGMLKEIPIPIPDNDTQNRIVAAIEEEQALVQANRQLITRFEQKIKARIARVWGDDDETHADGADG